MSKIKKNEKSLADILFPTLSEEELSESILNIPPEQRRLQTETLDFSISTILDSLEKGHIFIPEFQRRYVWSVTQASRLIESLIIQCPIPVIYLNQEKDEKLSVIDGNQRIISLQRFIKNQFKLKGLTTYPELEGLHFFELDSRFQRHILNRTLRCIVITKDTHPQIKFDVFERLNSGAVKLTPQELRHGIYNGTFMKLVAELGKNKTWKSLINPGAEKRMKTEELIIRFFAFHYHMPHYKQPLASFLNEFAELNREISEAKKIELTILFNNSVLNLVNLYGDLAFKVFDKEFNAVNNFNAALFDAEMLSLSHLNKEIKITEKQRHSFQKKLAELFYDDDFIKTISKSTSNKNQIKSRIKTLTELVNSSVNAVQ
ncbi:MAG: DUF262 domain-containing protein [Bacteroidota bacterium]|nr:DUF262 domain-containing protein [Bacteroidota bacterium]